MPTVAVRTAAMSAYRSIHQAADGREGKSELLEMLLDGLAACLSGIRNAHLSGDLDARSLHVTRASRIVVGLERALDPNYGKELTQDLSEVYRYFLKQLNRIKGDQALPMATELLSLTNILRSAFLSR